MVAAFNLLPLRERFKRSHVFFDFSIIMKLSRSTLVGSRITVSIDDHLRDDLNFLTDELNINRSALIRDLILQWTISRRMVFNQPEKNIDQFLKNGIGYAVRR